MKQHIFFFNPCEKETKQWQIPKQGQLVSAFKEVGIKSEHKEWKGLDEHYLVLLGLNLSYAFKVTDG